MSWEADALKDCAKLTLEKSCSECNRVANMSPKIRKDSQLLHSALSQATQDVKLASLSLQELLPPRPKSTLRTKVGPQR